MADKSATEILQNTSKAFVGFETALRVARERLEGAAHAEQLAEAATREEGAGGGGGGGGRSGRAGMPDRFLLDREECQARADDASFRMTAMGGAILPLVGLVQRSTTFSECMSARGYTRR